MPSMWRGYGWAVFRVALMIAAVAVLSFPQSSSLHIKSATNIYASDEGYREYKPAPALLRETEGHCHSGLECSVPAFFNAGQDAQIRAAGFRLPFQLRTILMTSQIVPFDPPPPRILA